MGTREAEGIRGCKGCFIEGDRVEIYDFVLLMMQICLGFGLTFIRKLEVDLLFLSVESSVKQVCKEKTMFINKEEYWLVAI